MKILTSTIPFLISGALVGVLIGLYVFPQSTSSNETTQLVASSMVQTEVITPSPTPSPTPTLVFYSPSRISIPSININTTVESVGVDDQGKMATPQSPFNVGWYSLGSKPGQQGSVVIDGHYDLASGAPAAFFYLGKMKAGDEITITDEQGTNFVYVVKDRQIYDYSQVPLEDLFNNTQGKRLNLITCAGWWNAHTHNYSHRTVIYAELK